MNTTNSVKPKRLYIYTKDVIRITGKGKSAAQSIIRNIKKQLGKDPDSNITVIEFCQFEGLKLEDVNLFL